MFSLVSKVRFLGIGFFFLISLFYKSKQNPKLTHLSLLHLCHCSQRICLNLQPKLAQLHVLSGQKISGILLNGELAVFLLLSVLWEELGKQKDVVKEYDISLLSK